MRRLPLHPLPTFSRTQSWPEPGEKPRVQAMSSQSEFRVPDVRYSITSADSPVGRTAKSEGAFPLSRMPHAHWRWLGLATRPDISPRPCSSVPIGVPSSQPGEQTGPVGRVVVVVEDEVVDDDVGTCGLTGGLVVVVVDVLVVEVLVVDELVDGGGMVVVGGVTGTAPVAGGRLTTTSCGRSASADHSFDRNHNPSVLAAESIRLTSPFPDSAPVRSNSAHPGATGPVSKSAAPVAAGRVAHVRAVSDHSPDVGLTTAPPALPSETISRRVARSTGPSTPLTGNRRYPAMPAPRPESTATPAAVP